MHGESCPLYARRESSPVCAERDHRRYVIAAVWALGTDS